MAVVNQSQNTQLNGNLSFNEFSGSPKVAGEPGLLSKWMSLELPSPMSAIQRQAVLGAIMNSNSFYLPQDSGDTWNCLIMDIAESRSGQGMNGQSDINVNVGSTKGHNMQGTQNLQGNGYVAAPGHRIDDKAWQTVGSNTINVTLKYELSITKAIPLMRLNTALGGGENIMAWINTQLLTALTNAYEDVFAYEFTKIGRCLNTECFVDGNPALPVLEVGNGWSNFYNSVGNDVAMTNQFVNSMVNIDTYLAERQFGPYTDYIVKPMIKNMLAKSKSWIYSTTGYVNELQSQLMRTANLDQLAGFVNGRPLFTCARMSGYLGNALFDGTPMPDIFVVNREMLVIPKYLDEAFHYDQTPSNWRRGLLLKYFEYFAVYARPLTVEDVIEQKLGNVKSAAILYGYLINDYFKLSAVAEPTVALASTSEPVANINGTLSFTINASSVSSSAVNFEDIFYYAGGVDQNQNTHYYGKKTGVLPVKLNNYAVQDKDKNDVIGFKFYIGNGNNTNTEFISSVAPSSATCESQFTLSYIGTGYNSLPLSSTYTLTANLAVAGAYTQLVASFTPYEATDEYGNTYIAISSMSSSSVTAANLYDNEYHSSYSGLTKEETEDVKTNSGTVGIGTK